MNTIDTLTHLGLSDKEARVYLALLELGPTSAYAVAMKAKLKKPTVYFIMDQLVEKALVARVLRKRKQLFAARSPNELLRIEKARVRDLEQLVPELLAMAHDQTGAQVRTLVFEGTHGLEQAYYHRVDELHDSELLGFYGSARDINPDIENIVLEINSYWARHNIKTRAIVPRHSSLAKYRARDKEHKREVKIVPYSKYPSDVSIEITPLFVRMVMFKDAQCLIIENEKIVTVMRHIFEMVWGKK